VDGRSVQFRRGRAVADRALPQIRHDRTSTVEKKSDGCNQGWASRWDVEMQAFQVDEAGEKANNGDAEVTPRRNRRFGEMDVS
jgi:hypothetical protein